MDASQTRRLAAGTFEPSDTSEVDNIDVRRAGSPTPLLSRRASEGSTASQLFFDAQSHDGDDDNDITNEKKNGLSVSVLTLQTKTLENQVGSNPSVFTLSSTGLSDGAAQAVVVGWQTTCLFHRVPVISIFA